MIKILFTKEYNPVTLRIKILFTKEYNPVT